MQQKIFIDPFLRCRADRLCAVEAARKIKKKFPDTKVLILTVHEDQELLFEGLKSGACGYILKRAVKSELINAIKAVGRGDLYVHSPMIRVA